VEWSLKLEAAKSDSNGVPEEQEEDQNPVPIKELSGGMTECTSEGKQSSKTQRVDSGRANEFGEVSEVTQRKMKTRIATFLG